MKFAAALVCGTLVLGRAVDPGKLAPILETLQDIQKSIVQDVANESKTFAAFEQWCTNERQENALAVQQAEDEQTSSGVRVNELQATVASLEHRLEEIDETVAETGDVLQQVEVLWTKSAKRFAHDIALNRVSIDQVAKTLKLLGAGDGARAQEFLQLLSRSKFGAALRGRLDEPGESSYIVGILSQIERNLQKTQGELEAEEKDKEHKYSQLVATKTAARKALQDEKAAKTDQLTQARIDLLEAQRINAKAAERIENINKLMAETAEHLHSKSETHGVRVVDRAAELEALKQAIDYVKSVLKQDDAHENKQKQEHEAEQKHEHEHELHEPMPEPDLHEPMLEPELHEPAFDHELREPMPEPDLHEPMLEPELHEPSFDEPMFELEHENEQAANLAVSDQEVDDVLGQVDHELTAPALTQLLAAAKGTRRHGGALRGGAVAGHLAPGDAFEVASGRGHSHSVVNKLIAQLQETQMTDAEKKTFCENELEGKAQSKVDAEEHLQLVRTAIEFKTSENQKMQREVDQLNANVESATKALRDAAAIRRSERVSFEQGAKDRKLAVKILKQAVAVLQDFYTRPDPTGLLQARGGAPKAPPVPFDPGSTREELRSKQAMSRIMAVADGIRKENGPAKLAEQKAAEAYELLQADMRSEFDKLMEEITIRKSRMAKHLVQLGSDKEDRASTEAELQAAASQLSALHGQCDKLLASFERDTKDRNFQISQLRDVIDILSGSSEAVRLGLVQA